MQGMLHVVAFSWIYKGINSPWPRYIQAASSPKNILILLDTSGSMKGLRFSIARSTVNSILDTLSDEDYFNVMQVQSSLFYSPFPLFNYKNAAIT